MRQLIVIGAPISFSLLLEYGLILSVLLMGLAANIIAKYIDRYRWIAWGGLIVILWVACKMIYEGAGHVAPHIGPLFS
jgi:predicted tellurium resistance membrane protein TerC